MSDVNHAMKCDGCKQAFPVKEFYSDSLKAYTGLCKPCRHEAYKQGRKPKKLSPLWQLLLKQPPKTRKEDV